MIAENVKRGMLADFAGRFAQASQEGALSIREIPFLTQTNVRADAADIGLMERLRSTLGVPLPVEPNTSAGQGARWALWLGPDEWLVVSPQAELGAIEGVLQSALGDAVGSVVDLSANRTIIELRGPQTLDLLACGCALDLHPRHFQDRRCAQTLLARAQVILQRVDSAPTFYIYVRASFSWYLADWLLDALAGLRSGR